MLYVFLFLLNIIFFPVLSHRFRTCFFSFVKLCVLLVKWTRVLWQTTLQNHSTINGTIDVNCVDTRMCAHYEPYLKHLLQIVHVIIITIKERKKHSDATKRNVWTWKMILVGLLFDSVSLIFSLGIVSCMMADHHAVVNIYIPTASK